MANLIPSCVHGQPWNACVWCGTKVEKRRGRPPLYPPGQRTKVRAARASEAEVARWEAAAQKTGQELGAWLRDVANAAAR